MVREASSKLRRTSAPVKPKPSRRMPGSSFWLAKATRKRCCCDQARPPASASKPAPHLTSKCRRLTAAGAHPQSRTLADRFDVHEGAGRAHCLRHGHRQEERGTIAARRLGGDQVGPDVLDDMDAVVSEQRCMNRK